MKEAVTLTVPSHPKYLYIIRSVVYPLAIEAGFSRKEARRIVLAVDEACSNIIKYAYEGDPGQIITANLDIDEKKLSIRLSDLGRKPDVGKIAPRKLDDVRPGGLGTHFMAAVFDSITYDTSGDKGTVLTLIKGRS